MRCLRLVSALGVSLILTACGGGSGSSSASDQAVPVENPDTSLAPQFSDYCHPALRRLAGPALVDFDHVVNVAENEGDDIQPLRAHLNDLSSTLVLTSNGFPNMIDSVCSADGQLYRSAEEITDLFDLQINPENGDVSIRVRRNLDFEDNAFYQINYRLGELQQKLLVRVYDVQQGTEAEPLVLSSYNELQSFMAGQFNSDDIGLDVLALPAKGAPYCTSTAEKNGQCRSLAVALDRDIDASATAQSPWQQRDFSGVLNGRNHVISGLTIAENNAFLRAGDTRFTRFKIHNLGLEHGTFRETVFVGYGNSEISHVYLSGYLKPTVKNRPVIMPFAAGGKLTSVYTNLLFDLRDFNGANVTSVELGGLTGSTSSPLSLGAGYSNGAIVGNQQAVYRFNGGGIVGRAMNNGYAETQPLYSALSYQLSASPASPGKDQNGLAIPYFSYGGLGAYGLRYPQQALNNQYPWRFVRDRAGNVRPVNLGNRSRDLNNDGVPDINDGSRGMDLSAAGLTQVEARQASSYGGVWLNGQFDIKDGEMPVLTNMPYPHRRGASWLSADDPGVAFQRVYFDRYLSIEAAIRDPEPQPEAGNDDGNSSSDNNSDNNSGGTNNGNDTDNTGGDNDTGNGGNNSGGNHGGEMVDLPAAVNNCSAITTDGEYLNDGPAPDDFACVVTLLENTPTSSLQPHVLRLDYQDASTEMRLISPGFPNFIRRVSNERGLDIIADEDIAKLFGLRINPLNGEVSLQVNKVLDFETDGGFFALELSLGGQTFDVLLRLYDKQLGTAEEALKISSYSELRSFFNGQFVSDAIGFDDIALQPGERSVDCDNSVAPQHNCRGLVIELDRDIDARASQSNPWKTASFHGTLDGTRHVISGLTIGFDDVFLRNNSRFDRLHVKNLGLTDGRFGHTLLQGGGSVTHVFASGEIVVPADGRTRKNIAPILVGNGTVDAVYTNIRYDLRAIPAAGNSNRRLELSAFTGSTGAPMTLVSGYANGSVIADPERLIVVRAAGLSVSGFNSGYLTDSLFYSALSFQLPLSQEIQYTDGASRRVPYIGVGGLVSARLQPRYAPNGPFDSAYNWRFITDRDNNSRRYPIGNVDQDTNNDGVIDEFSVYSSDKGMVLTDAGITQVDARKAASFTGLWRQNGRFDIRDGEYPALRNMPYPHQPDASWLSADDPGVAYQRVTFNDYITLD